MKVKITDVDYVGYAFLALTILKMVIAYALLRPIIKTQLPKSPAEKISFFAIFIYFGVGFKLKLVLKQILDYFYTIIYYK